MISRKKIYWIISLSISAVLVVLIVARLYRHFVTDVALMPNATITGAIADSELDIVFGNDNAKLTVYMYSNYACSYCKKFFEEAMPELQEYIGSSQVKLVLKLVGADANTADMMAQKTAVCVNEHGNYEALHKLYTYNYFVIHTPEFTQMVNEFIDKDHMVAQCILGGEAENYLMANNQEFTHLGFKGTPVFVIRNRVYIGYRGQQNFLKIVKNELSNINN